MINNSVKTYTKILLTTLLTTSLFTIPRHVEDLDFLEPSYAVNALLVDSPHTSPRMRPPSKPFDAALPRSPSTPPRQIPPESPKAPPLMVLPPPVTPQGAATESLILQKMQIYSVPPKNQILLDCQINYLRYLLSADDGQIAGGSYFEYVTDPEDGIKKRLEIAKTVIFDRMARALSNKIKTLDTVAYPNWFQTRGIWVIIVNETKKTSYFLLKRTLTQDEADTMFLTIENRQWIRDILQFKLWRLQNNRQELERALWIREQAPQLFAEINAL